MKEKKMNIGDEDVPVTKFMTLVMNDGVPELHLRGQFNSPQENSCELAELTAVADEFTTIRVYINSEGGRADMMSELVAILKKFETVITIGAGTIASAGFLVWCAGTIRVIQPYTWVMAHRESYGMVGQTKNHKTLAAHNDRLFGKMMGDLAGDVLTKEEINESEHSDLYLLPEDLVARGVAIYWDDYVSRTRKVSEMSDAEFFWLDGVLFFKDDGKVVAVRDIIYEDVDTLDNFIYNTNAYPDEWYSDGQTVMTHIEEFMSYADEEDEEDGVSFIRAPHYESIMLNEEK